MPVARKTAVVPRSPIPMKPTRIRSIGGTAKLHMVSMGANSTPGAARLQDRAEANGAETALPSDADGAPRENA